MAKTQIYYDPNIQESVVEEDREFLEYFFDFPDQEMVELFLVHHHGCYVLN